MSSFTYVAFNVIQARILKLFPKIIVARSRVPSDIHTFFSKRFRTQFAVKSQMHNIFCLCCVFAALSLNGVSPYVPFRLAEKNADEIPKERASPKNAPLSLVLLLNFRRNRMRRQVAFNVGVDASSTETKYAVHSESFFHVDFMLKFTLERKVYTFIARAALRERSLSRVVQGG
jgi:hypothetical protein